MVLPLVLANGRIREESPANAGVYPRLRLVAGRLVAGGAGVDLALVQGRIVQMAMGDWDDKQTGWDGGASVWDKNKVLWDGGASVWDGMQWDAGASVWDGGVSIWRAGESAWIS